MPKRKGSLNTVYISERLQESLRPIAGCAMTTVVAPMGYGKTTAVNWYLSQRAAHDPCIIRISVYSDNLTVFWRSVQDAFRHEGLSFLSDYACPDDDAGCGLLIDDLYRELDGDRECYIFIDDFHLLTDERIPAFLCNLANRLPRNVHLIVAGRDRFLPAAEILRLGSRVYQIGTEQLRLNHTELAVYAHRCGSELSDEQISRLLYSSEGWFSAVYLNLRALAEHGELPDKSSDIYMMFSSAMIDPLPEAQREFLAVMGLADEFTPEMARFVTQSENADRFLAALTEQNAFAQRLPDGMTYRFHHMMKECAERVFRTMSGEKQNAYLNRFGVWYESRRQYLHALSAYRKSGNFDAVLRVIQSDAGVLLAGLSPETVLDFLSECPEAVLKEHPFALLVLMRRMFTWRQIPKMTQLKELLLRSIDEHPGMPDTERGNLLGECDLILSFLCYNDISAMSRLHRSASRRMSRPAISIQASGGWSFGSPSVLMMFHRTPGGLERELAEMDECMPHYYKVTQGHGLGAETIMRAEAAFMQARFTDAQIALESAYAQIDGNGQENMALCCDFLAYRLSLFSDVSPRYAAAERYKALLSRRDTAWIHLWNAINAYYYAVLGQAGKIPPVFSSHRLGTVNFLAPGKPMMEMIENQVCLAQGAYAAVIGRSERLLAMCDAMHYALTAMHIRIQTAAAFEMLGKREEAHALLSHAFSDAEPDGFIIPFAENYRYLKPLLGGMHEIAELGTMLERHRARADYPMAFSSLTPREREIASLISQRLSNREIAERLYLSEGSVKQYLNQLYAKLSIEGDTRTKRRRLSELAES